MVFQTSSTSSAHDAAALFNSGNLSAAEVAAAKTLRADPKDVSAMHVLARIAAARRNIAKTKKLYKKCIALSPDPHAFHCELGQACLQSGAFDDGLTAFDAALALKPDDPVSIAGKADLLEKSGRLDEAKAFLSPLIERPGATPSMIMVMATILKREGDFGQAISFVNRALESKTMPERDRALLWQIAGECLDRLGEVDHAFSAFTNANHLLACPFDRDQFRARVDRLMSTFSRQNLENIPSSRDRSTLPVFIVSMPRAGSTLVEQIIHAHPQAHGAGEIAHLTVIVSQLAQRLGSMHEYPECAIDLTQEEADNLASMYRCELRQLAPGKKRIVDKHLDNWRFLGLISRLFPKAHIINVTRDPLDNGFGIYRANLGTGNVNYTTDLRNIGFAYRQYRRLMKHWRETLDLNMLDVRYEDLVNDQEEWMRRIIDFIDLKWDDRCLQFYTSKRDVVTLSYGQVRQPIYTSAVGRWKKYEAHLEPLKQELRHESQG